MKYHNITKCDLLNGEGVRVVLWVSHCEHNCKGCHNPQTHSSNGGIDFNSDAKEELFESLRDENIIGATFSGGDPLSTINREEVLLLSKEIKENFPDKNIWIYTGYLWDDIKSLRNIKYVDILVDGKYVDTLSFPSPRWCGSSNQRVIDVHKSLKENKIVKYSC
ncbi:MAG: anaerobic ribonucleoside-triphosphate reductase activating protein [Clostridium sp.]